LFVVGYSLRGAGAETIAADIRRAGDLEMACEFSRGEKTPTLVATPAASVAGPASTRSNGLMCMI
jgi:uncharacterized beta-barrel protein YwiB (DUF1934 family)